MFSIVDYFFLKIKRELVIHSPLMELLKTVPNAGHAIGTECICILCVIVVFLLHIC